jgi:O-methyltransferase involved in polyketide biosynthesis
MQDTAAANNHENGRSNTMDTTTTTTHSDTLNDDVIIQKTADDALLTKIAAVEAGYYEDPFLGMSKAQQRRLPTSRNRVTGGDVLLATAAASRRHRPMEPLIKRGTHARVCCMDRAISAFFRLVASENNNISTNNTATTAQVLVLGAGKDTSYFRYQAGLLLEEANGSIHTTVDTTATTDGMESSSHLNVHWYEVDHASLIQEKAAAIRQNEAIFHVTVEPLEMSSSFADSGVEVSAGFALSPIPATPTPKGPLFQSTNRPAAGSGTSTCFLVAHDLRTSTDILFQKLQKTARFDASLPTLILMECVLMYMPENASRTLLQSLAQHCTNACLCTYEPILDGGKSSSAPSAASASRRDPFGKVMEDNLIKAGVAKPDRSVIQTRTLTQHLSKQIHGSGGNGAFVTAVGCDMWSAYETILTAKQRQRANQCEFLDEMEEFVLIMKHYCFTTACTAGCSIGPRFCHVSASLPVPAAFARPPGDPDKAKAAMEDASPLGLVRGKSETLTRNP